MPLPFSCLALCLALRSVPISGNEIVTLGKPRYSVLALLVLTCPSSLPALRADARAARYESISPYPIGARYSVLASLVLTAQSDPKTGSSAQMPLPFSLARTLPRSPLRSDNGHRNRDGSLRSPIPSSLRSSLRLPLYYGFTICPKIRLFGSFFHSSRADGGDNGSAPLMTRFSRQSGCTPLCSRLRILFLYKIIK